MQRGLITRATFVLWAFSESAYAFQDMFVPAVALPGIIIGLILAIVIELIISVRKGNINILKIGKNKAIIYVSSFVSYILISMIWIRATEGGIGGIWGVASFDYTPDIVSILYQMTIGSIWFRGMPKGYNWMQYISVFMAIMPLFVLIIWFSWVMNKPKISMYEVLKDKYIYLMLLYISIMVWLFINETEYFWGV